MSKRPFLDTMRELEAGDLVEDLTDAQHAIVAAIEEYGGVGEITLKLKYKRDGKQIQITSNLVHKTPKPSRGISLFFVTPENNLSRDDPRQKTFDIRPPEKTERKVESSS